MQDKYNLTYLFISHDLSVVATSCKKVIVLYAGRLMEYGNVREILSHPAHPYTEGLIASFPSLHGKKEELKSIPGFLPDLADPPKGCIFAPRCPYAQERCAQEVPALQDDGTGHVCACHFPLA